MINGAHTRTDVEAVSIADIFKIDSNKTLVWDGFLPDGRKKQRWEDGALNWDLHLKGIKKQGGNLAYKNAAGEMVCQMAVIDIDAQGEDKISLTPEQAAAAAFKANTKLIPFKSPRGNWHMFYFFNKEFLKSYIFNQIINIDTKKNYNLKFLPIGIKDNINTKFLSTNYGLRSKKKFMAGNNANIVDKIINNGGLIFSKTNCAEYAVHHISEKLNINPNDDKFIAGTSSTGSAIAVSCGALPVAIGTQTAGSIIRPSSFCGVYGFKPTFGSIDRTGILKNNDLFDTVGIIAAEIEFIELVFKNIFNNSKDFPWSKKYKFNFDNFKNKKNLKIGYFDSTFNIYKNSTIEVKNFYKFILNNLEKSNILTIDLSTFLDQENNLKQYFPLGYIGHFNKKGYKKISSILIDEIEKRK